MGIVIVMNFVAGTLLAYFVSHMNQRVARLNIAWWGSAVCTGLYAAATGLQQLVRLLLPHWCIPITGDAESLFPHNRVNLNERDVLGFCFVLFNFLEGITFDALCESRS